ncbi:PF04365 family protein [Acinetobacter baumannii UH0207]|nr:PF04365 family protein [Acinetobacter baumannii UH0207]
MIHYCIYKFECFLWNSILNGMRLRIERIRKSMISLSKLQALVFEDPLRISIQDRHTNGEERWQTIGRVKGVLMLLVAHTIFDEDDCEIIRIISARQVTKAERNKYEHG